MDDATLSKSNAYERTLPDTLAALATGSNTQCARFRLLENQADVTREVGDTAWEMYIRDFMLAVSSTKRVQQHTLHESSVTIAPDM